MPRLSPRKKAPVNYNEEDKPVPKAINGKTTTVVNPSKDTTSKDKISKSSAPNQKRKASAQEIDNLAAAEEALEKPAAKKRKSKPNASSDAMPLTSRTAVSSLKHSMYIGAHVSAAGGVQNAIANAVHIGANSFALFLKSQRKWDNPPLSDEAKNGFLSSCKDHSYSAAEHALPHGSYLVNLAQVDKAKGDQAYKSFVDDLRRCDSLGVRLYNFHPGNTGGEDRKKAIGRIAARLNSSHKETESVVTVLENMAGGGNVIGSTWEDLRDVIALVDDKQRVGVCIDTCHAFAAGYDLRTEEAYEKTMGEFDKIVGKKYLKAFHLNDSKAPFSSHRDLHANIGTGFLGLRAFHSIMNDASLAGLPMILETPIDKKDEKGKTIEDKQVWADEIKLLESLIGMDAETPEFQSLSEELQKKGESERQKIQGQVDKKTAKSAKKK